MTLRALRRDIAVLAAAAAVSISFSAWVHGQTCALEATPEAAQREALAVDVVVSAPDEHTVRAPAPMTYGEHFAFVVDLEAPYVVLATDVDATWEAEFDGLLGVDTVFRQVDGAMLPPDLAVMQGTEMVLWATEDDGRAQKLGTAKVGAPRLVSQAAGALGPEARLDTWALHERLERDGVLPAALERRVEAAIWEDGLRLLVAPLEGARASEATWARSADLPDPELYRSKALDPAVDGAMQRAFLSAPEGRVAADEHERLEHGPLMPHIVTQAWSDATGETRLATAFVDSPHLDVCGGFDRSFALGARFAHGQWHVPTALPSHHTMGPALVGDFNADGFADMLLEPRPLDGDTTILRGVVEGFEVLDTLGEVPYFGCRC